MIDIKCVIATVQQIISIWWIQKCLFKWRSIAFELPLLSYRISNPAGSIRISNFIPAPAKPQSHPDTNFLPVQKPMRYYYQTHDSLALSLSLSLSERIYLANACQCTISCCHSTNLHGKMSETPMRFHRICVDSVHPR